MKQNEQAKTKQKTGKESEGEVGRKSYVDVCVWGGGGGGRAQHIDIMHVATYCNNGNSSPPPLFFFSFFFKSGKQIPWQRSADV